MLPGRSASLLPLLTAAEMQAWDRRAIDVLGVPERVLMESAGRAAARVLHRLYPRGRVVGAVGRGNNGGDALVLLRSLRAWGREVAVVPVGGAEPVSGLLHGWELPVVPAGETAGALAGAGVVVDGILGTGARGAPREPQAEAIRAIRSAGAPVLALDGPSGVDLTDGSTPGEALHAEVTVSFGAPKRGLLLHPGRQHAGRLMVVEVGFPPLQTEGFSAAVITSGWVRRRLPRLPPSAHKGTAGAVTLVVGRVGMGGAAILCAHGALRAGAGMVRVVTFEPNRTAVQGAVPEALFVDREGEGVVEALRAADAIVAGPGMGTDDASLRLLRRALEATQGPVLLDADAITLLSRHPDLIPQGAADRVLLTPHPGEMARLLDKETAGVVGDPFAAATEAAERFGCAVLLKGAPTLVAAPGEATLVNVTGHSGVATGGMGDTLAGVAGALLAIGTAPREAGALAVFLAGRAAELAGRGRSLLPRDVAEALPAALEETPPPGSSDHPEVVLDLAPAR